MTEIYTTVSLGLVIGWLIYVSLRLGLAPKQRVVVSLVAGIIVTLILRTSIPFVVLSTFIAPASLGLNALILRSFMGALAPIRPVSLIEQALILAVLLAFYASSAGMMPLDFYRLGYDPLLAGFVATSLSLYAAIRRYVIFAIVPVSAQVLWLAGVASSNYFDHLFSAVMVLVLPVSILSGLVRRPES